jgi:hypothetical protein
MKSQGVLVLVWALTATMARIGVLGAERTDQAYMLPLALIGSGLGALAGVWLSTKLNWLPSAAARPAGIGAVTGAGLAVLVFLAVVGFARSNGPMLFAVLLILAGVGALAGSGRVRDA